MSNASDCSKENLFVELVTQRLRSHMDSPRCTAYFYHDDDHYDSIPVDTHSQCDRRLISLEKSFLSMEKKLDAILACQANQIRDRCVNCSPAAQPHSLSSCVLRPADAPGVTPVLVGSSARVASGFGSPPRGGLGSPSLSASPLASPDRFQFVCPLCLKSQFTPKSHCEHLRNAIDEGIHVCRFNPEHAVHVKLLQLFGSSEYFVRWWASRLSCLLLLTICPLGTAIICGQAKAASLPRRTCMIIKTCKKSCKKCFQVVCICDMLVGI